MEVLELSTMYSERILRVKSALEKKHALQDQISLEESIIKSLNSEFLDLIEAGEYLGVVANDTTSKILNFITGVINSSLSKLFPHDIRRIFLEKTLYRDQYPHISIVLETAEGIRRNLSLQSGTGLKQIISFLFILSLIEVRKGRRLLVMDELLSGLHLKAKRVIVDVIKIFAASGFQFVMVEYGINDLGNVYLVEKKGSIATVKPYGEAYTDDVDFVDTAEPMLV